jgi:hypothetical protein
VIDQKFGIIDIYIAPAAFGQVGAAFPQPLNAGIRCEFLCLHILLVYIRPGNEANGACPLQENC